MFVIAILEKKTYTMCGYDIEEKGCIMSCKIEFTWDSEASVWIATSKDVPGLVLESGSFDALIERVRYAVPELLELNEH